MFKDDLKSFVENNKKLVSVKETIYDDLYVLKYSKKCFYKNAWNAFLEECRGVIVDKDYNVVSFPYKKIYNYGLEAKAPRISQESYVTGFRKINGFMGAITFHNGDLLISTTGSTNSNYVDMIKSLIDIDRYKAVCEKYSNLTLLFEVVHSDDPHIIPEKPGMYLTGYREKSWESTIDICPNKLYMIAEELECMAPEVLIMKLKDIVNLANTVKFEGFVIYTNDGVSTKIKSPYYLFSKLMARMTDTNKLFEPNIKQKVPEEFFFIVDHVRENLELFSVLTEQQRLDMIRQLIYERNTNG